MKKLLAKLRKARSLISIKTYKRPMIFVIMTMLLLNIVILVIAALIAIAIDDSFEGFIDAFANGSLKWMLSPNSIISIENPQTLFLAVIVLITGMILFTGTIIALTTNSIKDYIQKKQSGSGKILLNNHIVILNWNNKVPELVSDLLYMENRQTTVMILADVDKSYAEKQIVNTIHKIRITDHELDKINVLVKKGDPLIQSDLMDISIQDANSILVMNKDMDEEVIKDLSKSDLNIIKTLLSLGRIEFHKNPPIIAEIKHIETKEKIATIEKVVHTLHEHKIIPICFDRRLGQIIAQTIINPLMEDVYLSLFSFEGSEIYFLPDMEFDDCLMRCSHAFPIAKTAGGIFVQSLSDDLLHRTDGTAFEVKPLKTKPLIETSNIEVHILGKNNKLNFILDSFHEYERLHKSSFKSDWISDDELPAFVDKLNQSPQFCTIVLLSDDTHPTDSLDANVINTLIYLEGHLTRKNINIIVELLEPKNDGIIKDFSIRNTIISNKIISLLLSKIALYKETAPFYENLLTIACNDSGEDDQAIVLKAAEDWLGEPFPIRFDSQKSLIASIYHAFGKKVIPLGYFRNNSLQLFEGNLNAKTPQKIEIDDLFVLMKL